VRQDPLADVKLSKGRWARTDACTNLSLSPSRFLFVLLPTFVDAGGNERLSKEVENAEMILPANYSVEARTRSSIVVEGKTDRIDTCTAQRCIS